jgi:hypothetical protein
VYLSQGPIFERLKVIVMVKYNHQRAIIVGFSSTSHIFETFPINVSLEYEFHGIVHLLSANHLSHF